MYFPQRGTQQGHALRQKTLLRSQPKRASGPRLQESSAVGPGVRVLFPSDGADVFVGRAIAVVSVLRADSVTVLGDLAGDPVCFGKCSDHIAHELRFANASRVPANNNDAPVRFAFLRYRHCVQVSYFPSAFASDPVSKAVSKALMRAASSGSRVCHTYCSLKFSSDRAGVPQTVCPLRTILPPNTPDCPPITAPSSRWTCSPNPACPPITTFFPNTQDPDMP